MLSDATLERVSVAYRRGYRDGAAGRKPFLEVKPSYIKPFAEVDYINGYKAGANDARWAKVIPNAEQSA
jgi:ribosome modulation factor